MAPTWYFVLSSHSFLDRCVIAACIVCLFSNLPTNYLPRLLLYAQHFPNLRASERWDTKVLCSVSAPIDRKGKFSEVGDDSGGAEKRLKICATHPLRVKPPKPLWQPIFPPLSAQFLCNDNLKSDQNFDPAILQPTNFPDVGGRKAAIFYVSYCGFLFRYR